jgi:hypothetical protein
MSVPLRIGWNQSGLTELSRGRSHPSDAHRIKHSFELGPDAVVTLSPGQSQEAASKNPNSAFVQQRLTVSATESERRR